MVRVLEKKIDVHDQRSVEWIADLTKNFGKPYLFCTRSEGQSLDLGRYLAPALLLSNYQEIYPNQRLKIGLIGGRGYGKTSFSQGAIEAIDDFKQSGVGRDGQMSGYSEKFGFVCRVDCGSMAVIEDYARRRNNYYTKTGLDIVEHVQRDFCFEGVSQIYGVFRLAAEGKVRNIHVFCSDDFAITDGFQRFLSEAQDFSHNSFI